MTLQRSFLLDVTRALATSWTGRKPTGIDRVCDAYLRHYRARANAVIQHRGVVKVLTARHSDALFTLLEERTQHFRWKLAQLGLKVAMDSAKPEHYDGKIYLNVGHTDFDLPGHWQWVRASGLTSYYMVHDLIPIKRPDLTRPHAVRRHSARIVQALHKADGIITNSHSTLVDLRNFAAAQEMSIPPAMPAHLGVDHVAGVLRSPLASGNHFVCLSTIEPRKNHLLLLRVWRKLIERLEQENVPKLVLIGQWGRQAEHVRTLLHSDCNLSRHVLVLDDCGDAEMLRWLESAQAVLLPSIAEGYGLPLAEAMALKIPVIASDLPCYREIGDSIPLLVPATDDEAWETAITRFLNDRAEAERQRRLLSNHQPRSWDGHFRLVEGWIADLPKLAVTDANTKALQRRVPGSAAFAAARHTLHEKAPGR